MHDSTTCPVCQGQPGGSMSEEQFFAFLQACRDELAAKQGAFDASLQGESRWDYDLAEGSLTVGSQRFAITAVGTHSAAYQSWLWAWANEDFPAAAREAARRVQGLHERTGFRVFVEDGVRASSLDAQDLTAMAVHHLGAIGLFRAPAEDGPILYLAVRPAGGG